MKRVALWQGVAERLYAWALVTLPADFRALHAADMRATFRDHAVAALTRGAAVLVARLLREVADVLLTSIRLRWAGGQWAAPVKRSGSADWRMDWSVDVRHALRVWLRRPGLTVIALLVIALGIGATSAVFTVVDTVLFRPLPHREPDRLVQIAQTQASMGGQRIPASYPNLRDWQADGASGFDAMAGYLLPQTRTVDLSGDPEALLVTAVTGNLFAVLGNEAVQGRVILDADEASGASVAVISHALWQSRFAGSRSVLGASVRIDGQPYEVVGVAPRGFAFPRPADMWVPFSLAAGARERDTNFLQVVGRLAPGVSLTSASERMAQVMGRLVAAYPAENEGVGIQLTDLRTVVTGNARPAMQVLLGAVALLLVLSCASVGNLLLARMSVRRGELAVRGALGANRGRLVRQLLTESLLLAAIGGVLGLGIAWLGTRILADLAPLTLPRRNAIALDLRSVLFTAATTLASGLLFGIAPALRASRGGGALLRPSSKGAVAEGRQRLLRGLVVVQLATAVVLLVGGGLLLRSFVQLSSVDPGFRSASVFSMRVALPARYDTPARVSQFFSELVERASGLPGVLNAAGTWAVPFGGDWASGRVTVEGRPLPEGQEPLLGMIPIAGPYFETLGQRVVTGRSFNEAERSGQAAVAVLNESAARLLYPDGNAIGRRFKTGSAAEDDPWATVIGIVTDVRRFDLAEPARAEAYLPHHQQAGWAREMNILVRTAGDPLQAAAPLRAVLRELDPELAMTRAGRLSDFVSETMAEPRFRTVLLAVFAGAALILALAGIYGVMAFAVAQQTREIGVRLAIGAARSAVIRQVLGQGATLIAFGIVLGTSLAVLAARTLETLLFGVRTSDIATYGIVIALLAGTATLACTLPALRASRVPPVIAMREG
jgi:putative ABC transport system permease protein